MKTNQRYVFDTNVIISALLFEYSMPGKAFYAALDQGEVLISLPVIEELNEVLSRKKFNRYILLEEREHFLDALVRKATIVEITEQINACRDIKI